MLKSHNHVIKGISKKGTGLQGQRELEGSSSRQSKAKKRVTGSKKSGTWEHMTYVLFPGTFWKLTNQHNTDEGMGLRREILMKLIYKVFVTFILLPYP
jgi:hypothetical protein